MFRAYRCRLCGDVYLGDAPPSHCPYCGAHAGYLVPASDWSAPAAEALSPPSRANLEGALGLELGNAAYYAAAGGKVQDRIWQGIFNYLARIEGEHASTIRKTLGLAANPPAPPAEVKNDLKEAINEVRRRETRAEEFYQRALAQASEGRVQEVFRALTEVEADHLALAERSLAGM